MSESFGVGLRQMGEKRERVGKESREGKSGRRVVVVLRYGRKRSAVENKLTQH